MVIVSSTRKAEGFAPSLRAWLRSLPPNKPAWVHYQLCWLTDRLLPFSMHP